MNENQNQAAGEGAVQPLKLKVTLELHESHAPGIVGFLHGLPARTETAFIRGLIYQWMIDNQSADDYDQQLMAVLNGPGGRSMFTLPGAQSMPPRPSAPRSAPRKRAQTAMPMGDAPRHHVSHEAAEKVVPVVIPKPSTPVSPTASVPHQAVVTHLPPPATPAPTPSPVSAPKALPAAVADESEVEMNPFDNLF